MKHEETLSLYPVHCGIARSNTVPGTCQLNACVELMNEEINHFHLTQKPQVGFRLGFKFKSLIFSI